MSEPRVIRHVPEELRQVDTAISNIKPPTVDCSRNSLIKEYFNQRKIFDENQKIESSLQRLAHK